MNPVRTKAGKKKNSPKTSEKLRKEALAVTEKNIARIDAAEKGAAARSEGQAKRTKQAKAPKARKPNRVGGLDAAAKVLTEVKQPMNAKDLVKAMADKGYWKSQSGKTPHATIYAAMIREIADKGKNSRFKKTDRGLFTINA